MTYAVPDDRPVSEAEGLSLQATFADAVLASKQYLDSAATVMDELERLSNEAVVSGNMDRVQAVSDATEQFLKGLVPRIALGDAYARLAQALQHGAPGQRF